MQKITGIFKCKRASVTSLETHKSVIKILHILSRKLIKINTDYVIYIYSSAMCKGINRGNS